MQRVPVTVTRQAEQETTKKNGEIPHRRGGGGGITTAPAGDDAVRSAEGLDGKPGQKMKFGG